MLPAHNASAPVNPDGDAFTVIVRMLKHPVERVYVITAVPAEIPDTVPLEVPMVATAVLLLLQEPPGVPSERVVVTPTHSEPDPSIVPGTGFTVTVWFTKHPVGSVYLITGEGVVVDSPETIPETDPTVAFDTSSDVQVPPEVAELNVVVPPTHTFGVPVIAAGSGLIVNGVVILQPVPAKV